MAELNSARRATFTWATLPAASAWPVGEAVYISDVGVGGSRWITNGSIWVPEGGRVLLGQDSPAQSLTGNTTDQTGPSGTIRAIVPVPANMMGANGVIEIETLWTYTNSANAKNIRVRFGGTSGTLFLNTAPTTTYGLQNVCYIRNAGATNSQKGFVAASGSHYGTASGTPWPTTGAIDTTAAQGLIIGGQLTNTGETITLDAYAVWCRPAP